MIGGLLADDPGFWPAFGSLLILALGAAGAWAAARAIAGSWRSPAFLPFSLLLLAAAVRFLRYAIFGEDIASVPRFALAIVVLTVAAAHGYRARRVEQMTGQYPWLFAKAGSLGWAAKRDG